VASADGAGLTPGAAALVHGAARTLAHGKLKLAALLMALMMGAGVASALALRGGPEPDDAPPAAPPVPVAQPAHAAEPRAEKAATADLYGDPLPAGAIVRYGTLRLRHPRHAWAAAISNDRTRLATRDGLDRLLLWDLKSGKRLWIASPCKAFVLAFSPDGKQLAVSEPEIGTQLRDASTGEVLHTIPKVGRLAPIALAFTPDSKELLLGDETVRVWDLGKQELVREIRGEKGKDDKSVPAVGSALTLSPDGKLLAATASDARIWIWDLKTGKVKTRLPLGGVPLAGLSFSADSQLLAAGHLPWGEPIMNKARTAIVKSVLHPANVIVWDVKSGREVRRLKDLTHPRFLPDSKTMLAKVLIGMGPNYKLVSVDLKNWSVGKADLFLGHLAAFSADGRLVAAVGTDGLWLRTLPDGKRLLDLPGHETPVGLLALSPDGRYLASGHGVATAPWPGGYALHVWDTATARSVARLMGGETCASAAAFSRGGRQLAAAGMDAVVRVWDVPGWKLVKEVALPRLTVPKDAPQADLLKALHGKTVHALGWAGRRHLLTASNDGKVRVVDLEAGKVTGEFAVTEYNFSVRWRAAFTLDGSRVVTTAAPAWAIFDPRTGKLKTSLESKRPDQDRVITPENERLAFVQGLVVSDDGRVVAAATNWSVVRVWDPKTGKVLRAFGAAGHPPFGLAVSPDGRFVATAGERDRTVRLWRVADGKELASFSGHEGDVYSVAFAPDGRSVYSGSADCTVLRWDVTRWTKAAKAN
jgi:WD40 repeat protein